MDPTVKILKFSLMVKAFLIVNTKEKSTVRFSLKMLNINSLSLNGGPESIPDADPPRSRDSRIKVSTPKPERNIKRNGPQNVSTLRWEFPALFL